MNARYLIHSSAGSHSAVRPVRAPCHAAVDSSGQPSGELQCCSAQVAHAIESWYAVVGESGVLA